ncbi:unnamed protein product, partial [Staurois parvus]
MSGGQWRAWQRGVEVSGRICREGWRPVEGLAERVEASGGLGREGWRPVEGLAERGGGIGREGWRPVEGLAERGGDQGGGQWRAWQRGMADIERLMTSKRKMAAGRPERSQ